MWTNAITSKLKQRFHFSLGWSDLFLTFSLGKLQWYQYDSVQWLYQCTAWINIVTVLQNNIEVSPKNYTEVTLAVWIHALSHISVTSWLDKLWTFLMLLWKLPFLPAELPGCSKLQTISACLVLSTLNSFSIIILTIFRYLISVKVP